VGHEGGCCVAVFICDGFLIRVNFLINSLRLIKDVQRASRCLPQLTEPISITSLRLCFMSRVRNGGDSGNFRSPLRREHVFRQFISTGGEGHWHYRI